MNMLYFSYYATDVNGEDGYVTYQVPAYGTSSVPSGAADESVIADLAIRTVWQYPDGSVLIAQIPNIK